MIVCSKCGNRAFPYPHPRSQVCRSCHGENVTAYLAEADQVVAEHGFMLQGVMASEHQLQWVYTAGLTKHGLPELVMTSLPMEYMGAVLETMGKAAIAGDLQLEAGWVPAQAGGSAEGSGWWLIDVPLPSAPVPGPLSVAYNLAMGAEVRALQVVWPDAAGNWPWERGWWTFPDAVDLDDKEAQPLWGPCPRLCAACDRPVGDLWVSHTCHESGCPGDDCDCPEVCWQCCSECST